MKKNITKNIALLLVLTFIIGSVFMIDNGTVEATDSNLKTPFKYVITPNSPEWKNYSSQELKSMLNIPIEEAEKMDTKTLLKVVLDYPYLADIYAFNDPIKALDFLAGHFNGLKVLLEREDLKDELLKVYINSSNKIKKLKDKEKTTHKQRFKHKYIESLFAYPKVFNKLSKDENDTIISNSKKVATKMKVRDITKREYKTFGMETQYTLAGGGNDGEEGENPDPYVSGDWLRDGTVYTPKGNPVEVWELTELTDQEKYDLDYEYAFSRPNAVKIRTATYRYNCHSYAWYSSNPDTNNWWMDDPSMYMSDYSYMYVTVNPIESGQKVFYDVADGNIHSGIVHTPSGNYNSIVVESKWGEAGLYRHLIGDCPYDSTNTSFWKINPLYSN